MRKVTVNHIEASKRMDKELFEYPHIKLYNNHPVVQSRKETANQILQEYLKDSSVHGLKYFSNFIIKSGIIGKLFWIVIMIGSFVCT